MSAWNLSQNQFATLLVRQPRARAARAGVKVLDSRVRGNDGDKLGGNDAFGSVGRVGMLRTMCRVLCLWESCPRRRASRKGLKALDSRVRGNDGVGVTRALHGILR